MDSENTTPGTPPSGSPRGKPSSLPQTPESKRRSFKFFPKLASPGKGSRPSTPTRAATGIRSPLSAASTPTKCRSPIRSPTSAPKKHIPIVPKSPRALIEALSPESKEKLGLHQQAYDVAKRDTAQALSTKHHLELAADNYDTTDMKRLRAAEESARVNLEMYQKKYDERVDARKAGEEELEDMGLKAKRAADIYELARARERNRLVELEDLKKSLGLRGDAKFIRGGEKLEDPFVD